VRDYDIYGGEKQIFESEREKWCTSKRTRGDGGELACVSLGLPISSIARYFLVNFAFYLELNVHGR
jgi:hypothetical protein